MVDRHDSVCGRCAHCGCRRKRGVKLTRRAEVVICLFYIAANIFSLILGYSAAFYAVDKLGAWTFAKTKPEKAVLVRELDQRSGAAEPADEHAAQKAAAAESYAERYKQ